MYSVQAARFGVRFTGRLIFCFLLFPHRQSCFCLCKDRKILYMILFLQTISAKQSNFFGKFRLIESFFFVFLISYLPLLFSFSPGC